MSLWANSQHIDIGVLQCCQNEGVSSTKRKAALPARRFIGLTGQVSPVSR